MQQDLGRLGRLGCAECGQPRRRAEFVPKPLAGGGQRCRREAREGHAHALSRRTELSRKEVWQAAREQVLAANVDVAFLVQALPAAVAMVMLAAG